MFKRLILYLQSFFLFRAIAVPEHRRVCPRPGEAALPVELVVSPSVGAAQGLGSTVRRDGVLGSAAAEFVELEMWEEAVECYRHMQQVSVSLAPTVIGSNGLETPMKSDGNCCRQRL